MGQRELVRYKLATVGRNRAISMRPPRWSAVSESAYEWEREALDFLRAHLPDHEPYRAWSNLECIDDEGRINEVDALVLPPAGLILVDWHDPPPRLLRSRLGGA